MGQGATDARESGTWPPAVRGRGRGCGDEHWDVAPGVPGQRGTVIESWSRAMGEGRKAPAPIGSPEEASAAAGVSGAAAGGCGAGERELRLATVAQDPGRLAFGGAGEPAPSEGASGPGSSWSSSAATGDLTGAALDSAEEAVAASGFGLGGDRRDASQGEPEGLAESTVTADGSPAGGRSHLEGGALAGLGYPPTARGGAHGGGTSARVGYPQPDRWEGFGRGIVHRSGQEDPRPSRDGVEGRSRPGLDSEEAERAWHAWDPGDRVEARPESPVSRETLLPGVGPPDRPSDRGPGQGATRGATAPGRVVSPPLCLR